MCTHRWSSAVSLLLAVSLIGLAACGVFGEPEVTPFESAKTEFDEALETAIDDGMVPTVPVDYVVLGFTRTDEGIYKTSYLRPDGADDTLELQHTATVCVGPDQETLEQECGSRTETGSFEVREFGGRYLLIFPEGALSEPVGVSEDSTSLTVAFDRGWELWAPES